MLEKEKLIQADEYIRIAKRVIGLSHADQTEVLIASSDEHLTRFAANTIHQNVSERDVTVRVRAVFGKKTGVATGNDLSDAALRKLVETAETAARFQKDNPDFRSLPGPLPTQEISDGDHRIAFVQATAYCTPEERARGAAAICALSRENGLQAAGAFSTTARELLVANSLGILAYHCATIANIVAVVMGEDSSGYGSAASLDVRALDPEATGRVAVEKALRGRNSSGRAHPSSIADEYIRADEAGKDRPYIRADEDVCTVILEEDAVADMLTTLGFLGFGALAMQEGRSFMNGHLGDRISGGNITIWDDGRDERGIPMPFDFEGVPKQRVTLIENGIARGVVYDSFTAGREEGKASTGHSLPAPNTSGPLPLSLFMAPGQATKEQMLASTERGIWVTRFHYTNPVHPVKTTLTGMTRDGTFLIENGELTRPLKNMRFTESILEAFSRVEMLSSELKLIVNDWSGTGTCVPAAKINGFRFTGTTEF